MLVVNEENIISALPRFIKANTRSVIKVIDGRNYGVMGFSDAAVVPESSLTSVDHILRCKEQVGASIEEFTEMSVAVEVKDCNRIRHGSCSA